MKNKNLLLISLGAILITLGITQGLFNAIHQKSITTAQTITVKPLATSVIANGVIHSENEAILHFQTGGKLVYLPIKIGDSVTQGQSIAQLDTYPLQQQLSVALNNYRSTRDTFDQTQQNSQNGVIQGSQAFSLQTQNTGSFATRSDESSIISDTIKRIVDENQAILDNSVVNVNLANYALQLATITAPFTGVITAEDVTTPNINVTPATSFSIADPSSLVFKANVAPQDLPLISVGSQATITLSKGGHLSAAVEKIYPQALSVNGENVYQVDIVARNWGSTKLGDIGSVSIKSAEQTQTVLVPDWLIVGHTHIWILKNGKAVLVPVSIGKTYGDTTEILSGITPGDRIITDPTSIAKEKYLII